MQRKYLGDSYDAVKRLWQTIFDSWAPLRATPRFVPAELYADFTAMTGIPILNSTEPREYSVFNDPDTGIHLPTSSGQADSVSHIGLATICSQLQSKLVRCVITYDQSHHRKKDLPREAQRQAKLEWLLERQVQAFYYVSHAPFLFAFRNIKSRDTALGLLTRAGIPRDRFHP